LGEIRQQWHVVRSSNMRPEFYEQNGYITMTIDGATAGREVYRDHETADGTKQRIFVETVVEEDYRGAGLAGRLVKYSLDAALDAGYRIVAICPYVKKWIENADAQRYRDATDTARPEQFSYARLESYVHYYSPEAPHCSAARQSSVPTRRGS